MLSECEEKANNFRKTNEELLLENSNLKKEFNEQTECIRIFKSDKNIVIDDLTKEINNLREQQKSYEKRNKILEMQYNNLLKENDNKLKMKDIELLEYKELNDKENTIKDKDMIHLNTMVQELRIKTINNIN